MKDYTKQFKRDIDLGFDRQPTPSVPVSMPVDGGIMHNGIEMKRILQANLPSFMSVDELEALNCIIPAMMNYADLWHERIEFEKKLSTPTTSGEAEDFEAEAEARKIVMHIVNQWGNAANSGMRGYVKMIVDFARQMSLNQHKAPVTCVEDYPKPLVQFLLNTYALQVTETEAFKILHDTASVPDITVQHKAEGASHKIEIYEQALNTILYMKKDPGETDSKYAFNRCWHAANDALTAGAVITTQPAPIDPLKARQIAEKAWDKAVEEMNNIDAGIYPSSGLSTPLIDSCKGRYLETHYPLPSDTDKLDIETDHEDPDLEKAIT